MDDARLARVLSYVDGELSPADRRAFEAELAADPSLAAEVAAHRALVGRVSEAYAPVLDEPAPLGLTLAVTAANDRRPSFGLRMGAAAAASLVLGLVLGRVALAPQGSLAETADGLSARGQLARHLTTALASDAAGPVRVGLTFRDTDGRYCRTFQSEADRLAGLACRDGGEWRVEAALAWTAAPAPQYRTAASETPPALLTLVDDLRAGDPLDAAQEREARDRGWR